MTEAPLRPHHFIPSGQRAFGWRICTCGSREFDSIHTKVPEQTDEQREHEQRKVGERDA